MRKSKNYYDKQTYTKLAEFKDTVTQDALLTAYMHRCKGYHSLAFFQFRRTISMTDEIDAKDRFEARVEFV